jgi:hypothetical protein
VLHWLPGAFRLGPAGEAVDQLVDLSQHFELGKLGTGHGATISDLKFEIPRPAIRVAGNSVNEKLTTET